MTDSSTSSPRIPTTLQMIESMKASYIDTNSNGGNNALSSNLFSLSSDLGPEFLSVLINDFSMNQDWLALKRMGALDNNNDDISTRTTISAISGNTSFIPPPPIPTSNNHQSTMTSRFDNQNNVDNDDDEEEEEQDGQELDKNDDDDNMNTSIKPISKRVRIPGSRKGLGRFTSTSSSSLSSPDINLSQGALGALERVQLQMKLLSAQADSLSIQADRLEAEMTNESNGIDVHRATVILNKRGEVLKTLRGKSDVLLAKTTLALTK